jgi:penicillin amidase
VRLNEVLSKGERVTVEEMQRLQRDVVSPWAREVVPLILHVFGSDSSNEEYAQYLTTLRTWSFEQKKEDVATSIFEAFVHHLHRETFGDEMGDDLLAVYDTLAGMPLSAMDRLLRDPASSWFDDVQTVEREQRDDIVRRAFRKALNDLQIRLGTDARTWRWERLHTLTFGHVLGAVPVLAPIFNRGPHPVSGSHSTVNVGWYPLDGSFAMTVGASFRVVFDLSDPNGTRSVLPPGQSGHPFHDNYDDQIVMWLNGVYKFMPMDSGAVTTHAGSMLLLEPAR